MIITIPYYFSTGAVIIASQHNSNFATIYQDYNGNITDANIASTAAIEYTKLALTGNIMAADLSSITIIPTTNLPVGTANGDIVQLGASGLPAVSGALLTGITQGNLSSILNYGTSASSSSSVAQTSLKICFGYNISLSANGGTQAITNLPFATSAYCVIASANSGFGIPPGGTDQNAGMVYAYINSASQFTLYNSDDQAKTASWFAIGV